MINIRHAGIYVSDIELMTRFYENVFSMKVIVEKQIDEGEWLDILTGIPNSKVQITKLLSEKGKEMGVGDMLELVEIITSKQDEKRNNRLVDLGTVHIALGVDNIEEIIKKLKENGGKVIVPPFIRSNGHYLAFAKDIEDNWIEIIQ